MYLYVALSRCQAFGMRVHVNVSVIINVNVQEQYCINIACRQLLCRQVATGCWRSIRHAHSREDSLLCLHYSQDQQPRSSVAKAWKSMLPAMRQNRRLPVHDVAWLLVGVHQYLLLSCRQVHISLVMSVLMLTIDSCSSSLAVAATQTRVPTVRYICMHDRTLFIAYNEQCVNKIATAYVKETPSVMHVQMVGQVCFKSAAEYDKRPYDCGSPSL